MTGISYFCKDKGTESYLCVRIDVIIPGQKRLQYPTIKYQLRTNAMATLVFFIVTLVFSLSCSKQRLSMVKNKTQDSGNRIHNLSWQVGKYIGTTFYHKQYGHLLFDERRRTKQNNICEVLRFLKFQLYHCRHRYYFLLSVKYLTVQVNF